MLIRSALALVMLVPSAAQAQATSSNSNSGYRLDAEDQIEVTIYGPATTIVRTRIKSNGNITLPLVGDVNASGLTVQALAESIDAKLKAGRFLIDPIVNVEVTAYASKTVTVLGQVGTPGLFPLDRPQTLGEMISRVGGVKPGASDLVTVRHENSNQVEVYSVTDIGRSAQRDVTLRPGDVIYASPAEQFYIYGQVGSAGVFPITPGMTVRQALARAGGPTQAGSERKITLYRDGKESDADINATLHPNDVLFVRERAF